MLRLRYGVSLGIVVFALQAFAADPDNGERLAQRWCAACRVVTPVQTSTTTDQALGEARMSLRGSMLASVAGQKPRIEGAAPKKWQSSNGQVAVE
jgi:hypothetical protein